VKTLHYWRPSLSCPPRPARVSARCARNRRCSFRHFQLVVSDHLVTAPHSRLWHCFSGRRVAQSSPSGANLRSWRRLHNRSQQAETVGPVSFSARALRERVWPLANRRRFSGSGNRSRCSTMGSTTALRRWNHPEMLLLLATPVDPATHHGRCLHPHPLAFSALRGLPWWTVKKTVRPAEARRRGCRRPRAPPGFFPSNNTCSSCSRDPPLQQGL